MTYDVTWSDLDGKFNDFFNDIMVKDTCQNEVQRIIQSKYIQYGDQSARSTYVDEVLVNFVQQMLCCQNFAERV